MKVLILLFTAVLALAGCSSDAESEPGETSTDELTYYGDTKAVIDAKCGTCHQPGQIGPFPLTTHEQVQNFAGAVRASIESGTMPPWQPDDECNTFEGNFDLTPDEKEMVLTWLDAGAPAGEPADEPTTEASLELETFATDISVELPEAYVPQIEPDDYRCQLIDWPAEETRYVTGVQVTPDAAEIVHHTIVFLVGPDQVEQYRAFDEAEEGPGYTCYGGPAASGAGGANVNIAELLAVLEEMGLTLEDVQSGNLTDEQTEELASRLDVGGGFSMLGSWVPGVPNAPYPEGTGIKVEPGSMLVVQMHYNTLTTDPVADKSTIGIATTDSVEKEATIMLGVDLGWISNGRFGDPMTIPAGDANVEHSTTIAFDSLLPNRARRDLGLEDGSPLVIYSANHHMHTLGKTMRSEIRRADGQTACMLDIHDWDFSWQGSYLFEDPVRFEPGDELWMGCTWDNSPENQAVVNGMMQTPVDVSWGEGTRDEMCLGGFYVTGG